MLNWGRKKTISRDDSTKMDILDVSWANPHFPCHRCGIPMQNNHNAVESPGSAELGSLWHMDCIAPTPATLPLLSSAYYQPSLQSRTPKGVLDALRGMK